MGTATSVAVGGIVVSEVKKHHVRKVDETDVYLYSEDIYGLHSIAYEPWRRMGPSAPLRYETLNGAFGVFRRGRGVRDALEDYGRAGSVQRAPPAKYGRL